MSACISSSQECESRISSDFQLGSEYARRKMNGVHRLLVCVNDANILTGNKNIINMDALLDIREEDALEINAEKTACIFISHHKNARQSHNINKGNTYFEYVKLKYLGRTLTN
jgi:hypothetical protein